jgi:hypothetical protein
MSEKKLKYIRQFVLYGYNLSYILCNVDLFSQTQDYSCHNRNGESCVALLFINDCITLKSFTHQT